MTLIFRVQFYYGNKSSSSISNFSTKVVSTAELNITESQTAPPDINPGAQALQILQIKCQKVYGNLRQKLANFSIFRIL